MSDTTSVSQAELDKCFPKKDGWDIYVFDDKESGNEQYKQDLYHFVINKSENEKAVYLNLMRLKYPIQMNYILKQLKEQRIRIPIRSSYDDNYTDWNDVPYYKIDNKEKFRKLISRIKKEETLQKIIPLIDESFTEFNKFKGNHLISKCIDMAKYKTSHKSNNRKRRAREYIHRRNKSNNEMSIDEDIEDIEDNEEKKRKLNEANKNFEKSLEEQTKMLHKIPCVTYTLTKEQ